MYGGVYGDVFGIGKYLYQQLRYGWDLFLCKGHELRESENNGLCRKFILRIATNRWSLLQDVYDNDNVHGRDVSGDVSFRGVLGFHVFVFLVFLLIGEFVLPFMQRDKSQLCRRVFFVPKWYDSDSGM